MPAQQRFSVLAAGLALFSMFFGAGDLIWPLILGGSSGSQNFYAMLGLLITGVSLPLLGLIAMMLFEGNYRAFFGRVGAIPGAFLVFIIQIILGPIGTIPRAITLSYATIKPYLPETITLLPFSIILCLLIFIFTLKRQKVIDILGLVLTPILLLSLGAILVIGFYQHPSADESSLTALEAFHNGFGVGYNTLDLIASFIFAPLVLSHFVIDPNDPPTASPQKRIQENVKSQFACSIFALRDVYWFNPCRFLLYTRFACGTCPRGAAFSYFYASSRF